MLLTEFASATPVRHAVKNLVNSNGKYHKIEFVNAITWQTAFYEPPNGGALRHFYS